MAVTVGESVEGRGVALAVENHDAERGEASNVERFDGASELSGAEFSGFDGLDGSRDFSTVVERLDTRSWQIPLWVDGERRGER